MLSSFIIWSLMASLRFLRRWICSWLKGEASAMARMAGAQVALVGLERDRVRRIADGVSPAEYGRREAMRVAQALKARGPVTVRGAWCTLAG